MKAAKDSAIYLVGELLSKSIPFLLLPYLSRKLGVSGFGELSYYQTYLALFVIILGLSQDGAIARYFYRYGRYSLDFVVIAGYSYTIFSGVLGLIFCWIFQSEIIAYLLLSAIFQIFLSVQLSIRQCQKQAISYIFIQIGLTITNTLFTLFMLELYESDLVEKRILAVLFSNILISVLAYGFYKKNSIKIKLKSSTYKKYFLYILFFGVPMILHHGSFFIKGQIDRIFIYYKYNESELGLYAMGVQIAGILSVTILAINKALVPYLFERLKQGVLTLRNLHKWALYSFIFIPFPLIIISMIPEEIFLWILGEQFKGVKHYIILFVLSSMLAIPYLFLVNYLFFKGLTKQISICSMLSVIFYLVSLSGLIFIDVLYIPFSSIIAAIGILPLLYFFTKKVEHK